MRGVVVFKPRWLVNDQNIDQTLAGGARVRVLAETQAISGVAMRLAGVQVAGMDGVKPVGVSTLGEASLGLKISAEGQSVAGRILAQNTIAGMLAGATRAGGVGVLGLETAPGQIRESGFRLVSLTWSDLSPLVATGQVELQLPLPVWEAKTPVSGSVGTGVVRLEFHGHEGARGPVLVAWTLPEGTTSFRAVSPTDSSMGVVLDPGGAVSGRLAGWGAFSGRVSQYTRVWPNPRGAYQVRVSASAPAGARFSWEAKPAWV